MPLLKPTFQPYFLDPKAPNRKNCGRQFCYPIIPGDIPKQQFKQTPCSGNMVSDPDFTDITLGADLITNGGFTGSSAGWTLGASWAYGTNNVSLSLAGSTQTFLSQSGIGLVTGTLYRITFDISFGIGAAAVYLGSGAGAQASQAITEDGSYTIDILHTDSNDILQIGNIGSTFNAFTIDNVTCRAVTINSWETNGIWNLSDETACKLTTGTGSLYNGSTDYITDGDYYIATVTVSGYGGSGTVSMYVDDGTGSTATNIQAAISANGNYTYYFEATQDGVIGFNPSTAFTGCISLPNVQRLRNDYPFSLINEAGDSIDISNNATYVNDRIMLNVDFQQLLEAGDIEDYGCYWLHVTDACLVAGDNVVTDSDFSNQNYTAWTRNAFTYQYELTGSAQRIRFDPFDGQADLVSNGDFSGGATDWTLGANWSISGGGALHTPGSTATLTQSITLGAIPPLPALLRTWYRFTISGRTAGSVTVSLGSGTSTPFTTNGIISQTFNPNTSGATTLTFTPTSNFDGTIDDVEVIQTLSGWLEFPMLSNTSNPLIGPGNYQIDFDIVSISGLPGTMGIYAGIQGQADVYNAYQELTVGSHSIQVLNYTPGAQRVYIGGVFNVLGINYPGEVVVDNVVAYAIEPFEATYESECLKFQESAEGTILMTAWCDQNAWDLDFENTDYVLQMRLLTRSYNAFFEDDSIVSQKGDGSSRVAYGQLEQFWQYATDIMSESAHTTLAAMIRSDHFTVGEAGEDATEYTAQVTRYQPEWRENGDSDLAPAIINLRLKEGGMTFNRHT